MEDRVAMECALACNSLGTERAHNKNTVHIYPFPGSFRKISKPVSNSENCSEHLCEQDSFQGVHVLAVLAKPDSLSDLISFVGGSIKSKVNFL